MLRRTPFIGGLVAIALAIGGTTAVPTYAKPPARAPQTQNCTYTQGYWKNHPNSWPVASLTLGTTVYSKTQLAAMFKVEPNGDATYILAHQLIAALLNISNGANDSAVRSTVSAAQQWLTANPPGSKPVDPARATGISYASTLDRFNNGLIGPGHCDSTSGSTPAPTSAPTSTPAPTSVPTSTPAPTTPPTSTPAPTTPPTSTPAPTTPPTSTPAPTTPPTSTPAPTTPPTSTPAPTSAPTAGTIRGTVWLEEDCDMMLSAGEALLANLTIELFVDDGDGWVSDGEVAVASTVTQGDGTYSFTDVSPGVYLVRYSGEWYTAIVTADLTLDMVMEANIPVAPSCGT